MTAIEVVECQNEIIKQQSDLIAVLFSLVGQHTAVDELEKQLKEIEALKQRLK